MGLTWVSTLRYNSSMGFHRLVYPHMQELANRFCGAVYFGVPNGCDVLYLEGVYPMQALRTIASRSMTGERAPLYCTGIGKAMLGFLTESKWADCLPGKLEKYSEYTITDRDALFEELCTTRRCGYSIDNMEHEFGIKCVGAPVFNREGQLVAGISLSGPSLRFNDERIGQIAEELLKKVTELRACL